MGNQQRRALKECLAEKTYYPGHKLINEGEYCNTVYLVREGECQLCSNISPKQVYIDITGQIVVKPKPAWNQYKGVFTGRTTDSFTFGIKGPQQWVGEDVLIMVHNEAYRYSVVALTRMRVLQIEKQDLLQRLSVSFISQLIKQAKSRAEWIEDRIKQIHYSMKSINQLQESRVEDREEWKRKKNYSENLGKSMERVKQREESPQSIDTSPANKSSFGSAAALTPQRPAASSVASFNLKSALGEFLTPNMSEFQNRLGNTRANSAERIIIRDEATKITEVDEPK